MASRRVESFLVDETERLAQLLVFRRGSSTFVSGYLPVFDRYHIVSPTDLQDVAAKLTGTLTGTIAPRAASGHLTPVP